jgi:PKD domain-containing protein
MRQALSRLCLLLVLAGLLGACDDDDDSPGQPTGNVSPTPAPPPTPVPTLPPPPPVGNQPPVPEFKVTPFPTRGPAPLEVNFNLCPTADPDGDRIVFFFDFGDGTSAQGPPCRQQNTYHHGRFTANMCVWDSRPEHALQCVAFPVDAQ